MAAGIPKPLWNFGIPVIFRPLDWENKKPPPENKYPAAGWRE
jgi:hypothetical protein